MRRIANERIRNQELEFYTQDPQDKGHYDVMVYIEGVYWFTISSLDVKKFIKDIRKVVEDYSI